MGKGGYNGGSTVIGPFVRWFRRRRNEPTLFSPKQTPDEKQAQKDFEAQLAVERHSTKLAAEEQKRQKRKMRRKERRKNRKDKNKI